MDFYTLQENLTTRDPIARDNAVQSMVALNDLRGIKVIAEFLESETEIKVIESMLEALKVMYALAPRVLIPLLSNDNPTIRNGIIRVLHESSDSVIKILDELATDQNKDIRKFALDALKSKKTPASIAVIRKRLDDQDENVRMTAVEYLGGLDDWASALKIASILMNSQNIMTHFVCLESLVRLKNQQATSMALDFCTNNQNIPVLLQLPFLKLLIQGGKPEHIEILEQLIATHHGKLSDELAEALISICQRHNLKELPESMAHKLKAVKERINPVLYNRISDLFSNQGRINLLESARANVASDDPTFVLTGLQTIACIGNHEDVDILESLADREEDEDVLDVISETITTIMSRLDSWKMA